MRVPSRLGPKLNLFLVVLILVLAGAISALVFFSFGRTQDKAAEVSREGLEAEARDVALGDANTQAFIGQLLLEETGALGQTAARFLARSSAVAQPASFDPARLQRGPGGELVDLTPFRRSDVFVPAGVEIDAEVERDLRRSAALDALVPELLGGRIGATRQTNFDAISIRFDSVNRVTRYYPPASVRRLAPDHNVISELLPAGPDANPERRTVWSPPYRDESRRAPVITARTPVYDGDEFRGVISVDLSLTRLIAQVDSIHPGRTGYAFYIDRDGQVLQTAEFQTIDSALRDASGEFGATYQAIRAGNTGVNRINLGGRDVFVAYAPLAGVGGSLALVAPVDEVTVQAGAVADSIEREGNRTLLFVLGVMGVFFVLALSGGVWLNRRVLLQPIGALVSGTRAVAAGNLDVEIPVQSSDELGMLADSFNIMTAELKHSRERLETQQQRTASSEAELRALFAAMTDVVLVLDREGRYLRSAPANDDGLLLRPREELVGKTMHDLMPPGQAEQLLAPVRRAIDTGATQHVEYKMPVAGRDVWFSAAVSPTPNGTALVVARDISDRVEAAQILEQRVAERTRDLETLLDVSQTVSSTLELQRLLGIILDQLKQVTDYTGASILIRENDDLVILESRGPFRNDGAVRALGMRFPLANFPDLWQQINRGEIVRIDDVRADNAAARLYRQALGDVVDTPAFNFVRSFLMVPLARRDGAIGMLTLSRDEPDHYTDEHANLALAIAAQAAVAIENARLFEQTRDRTRELATMLDVSRNVASTLELEPLLNLILEQMKSVADYDRAGFMIVEGDELVVRAIASTHRGPDPDFESQLNTRFSTHRALLWDLVSRGEIIIIDDVTADTQLAHAYRRAIGPLIETTFRGIRSWMGVPLSSKNGVIGMLTLSLQRPGAYDERVSQLTMAIANQAASAIENARLFEQTQQRTRQLTALLEIARGVASTLELRPLVRVIFEQLRSIIDYNAVTIASFSGEEITVIDVDRPIGANERQGFKPGWRIPMTQGKKIWDLVRAGQYVNIEDVRGDTEIAREYREGLLRGELERAYQHVQAWLCVPLALKDRIIGALVVSHSRKGYFTDDMARLVSAVGDQAAVAIENARLYEQAEARTRELSALLEVSQTVASTLELQHLVTVILEQLEKIVDYSGAALYMLEGTQLQIMYGARSARDVTYNMQFAVDSIPRIWETASRGQAVILPDIHAEDDPLATELRDACGPELMSTHFSRLRSWIAVPLTLKERIIGMLAVSHNDPAHFTNENTQLVRAVAHQAAIAIENARLYQQAEDRTRELSALLEVSNSVASTIQLGPLVAVILEQIRKLLDYDRASLLTVDGDALMVLDTGGRPAMAPGQNQRPLRFPIARLPQIWRALQRNELLIIEDLYSDEPFAKELRDLVGDELLQTLYPHVKSFMSVPLVLHDRPIGVIALSGPEPGFFRRDERHLIMAVASQAAVAIENARLYQQASQLAAIEERQRLARELHDSVSQALYGIALGARTARAQLDRDPARAAEPVEYVLSLAEAGLAEMRALIFELRPESLELEGLVAGLEKQASAMRARHHVEVEATLCDEPDVSLRVKEAISRIAQEALHNTVKHARATRVDMKLERTGDELAIEIRDNGAGFNPDGDFPGHLGLRSMRERAAKLGGTVQIESRPGEGTRVIASVPCA